MGGAWAVAMVVATVMDRGVRSNPVQSLEVEEHDTIMDSVVGWFHSLLTYQ